MSPLKLWSPSTERSDSSQLSQFMGAAAKASGIAFEKYEDLHAWSVERYPDFWRCMLDWSGIDYQGDPSPTVMDARIPGAKFFPGVRLNFAENLLRHSDDTIALVSISESRPVHQMTYRELRSTVARLQSRFLSLGIHPGDRIAGYVPNCAEAVAAMLAAASIGAMWSSCSPDFGVQGVLDRFGQIEPRILFAANGYVYNGRQFDCLDKISEIASRLPSLERVVVIPFLPDHPTHCAGLAYRGVEWSEFLPATGPEPCFEKFPFNHPLYVMFSSGTTGVPKCIVHGAGGTLIQHVKELMLHCDLRREDRIFYFTTCGWMMWNWLVSSLYTGCSVILFDGSPTCPDMAALWHLADRERITHFGTSAKYLASCRSAQPDLGQVNLEQLRVVLSTGSPLLPEDFDWVYSSVKTDIQLSSICGGTDIISCFMLGSPMLPVYRGEIQCFGLGMDIAAFDGAGRSVLHERGELVCRKPFPSMPVGFWNDPDGNRYHSAYFERFPGIWHHGDYVEITGSQGAPGGIVVYGRSDATLNPGGVRIGTAEIYRLVETLPEVEDSIVIGLPEDGDVSIVLFVKLRPGITPSETLYSRIRSAVREGATPRHVPKKIFQVDKIPYTVSGKKTELAVLDVAQGRRPANINALADPSAIEAYPFLSGPGCKNENEPDISR